MNEIYPTPPQYGEPKELASWLVTSQAKLDASESGGNVVTRLVVEDPVRHGKWGIALVGGIDIVNRRDLQFATEGPANLKFSESTDTTPAKIEAYYHGIDDEARTAHVDLSIEPQFIPDQA